jgi:signal transduction histidine kinase
VPGDVKEVAEARVTVGWLRRSGSVVLGLGMPALVSLLGLTRVAPVLPALLYLGGVCIASAGGGVLVGLFAAATSFVCFDYFFTPPRHSLGVSGVADLSALVAFVVVAAGISFLVARDRRARLSARQAHRRAEEESARTLRLEAVAQALTAARTPQQVLDAVLTEGIAVAEARAGLIGVLAEDGETVEVVAHRGYEETEVRFADWQRFRLDAELPLSEAIRTGNAVYLATTAERDRRYPLLAGRGESSHALTCLPLNFEGRPLGGLVLSFPGEELFDANRRALKEALAAQVAQALERARLDAAEQELRERLTFLAEASELLASSLDYEETLSQLAALVVPRLADWCAVDMLAGDGSVARLAVAHHDPQKVRYALELAEKYPPDPNATSGVAQVLRSGEPEFIHEITDDLLVEAVKGDQEMLRIIRELGLRSVITVPLIVRDHTIGALTLIAAETVKLYSPTDLRLAQDLARRAAVAVDNARLHAEAERRAHAALALAHVTEAVVLVDSSGRLRYSNQAAQRLLGEDPERSAEWERLRSGLDARNQIGGASAETVPIRLGGEEQWLEVSSVAFDEGVVYALRDVTEERLLERTRSEFVATASHELRTPIASVYGAFQTLLREDLELDRGQQQQFLRMGLHESQRLARIVEDLLLADQLDAGQPTVEPVSCDPSMVIRDVVAAATTRADGTHTLEVAVDGGLRPVLCDPLRLQQVLTNLVENAIKYSPDGGTVIISANHEENNVRIDVEDHGIGIPEREQNRIFERFVRLDPGLSRGVGGTGLGLYISKELIRRMGGTISVHSKPGEGSTFHIHLPTT